MMGCQLLNPFVSGLFPCLKRELVVTVGDGTPERRWGCSSVGRLLAQQSGGLSFHLRHSAEIRMEHGIAVHACNPRTREVETGGLGIERQPRLHEELDANLGYARPCFCFKAYGVVGMARSVGEGTGCQAPQPGLHPQMEEENQLLTVVL